MPKGRRGLSPWPSVSGAVCSPRLHADDCAPGFARDAHRRPERQVQSAHRPSVLVTLNLDDDAIRTQRPYRCPAR